MSDKPLLSYIVLSYNYERYIDKTIRSILNQTVQDFEIVVVDDCSRDNSVNIVRSFRDSRIRVLLNEQNMGGAASYNRAVSACKGEWLVNLDADDWIAPHKAERQLAFAAANPHLDIIGTYISVFDQDGCPHPNAEVLEEAVNQPHDFGRVDTWIGANHLCRSSTMVRSAAHRRVGLDDPNMVRAPDYELWTRALREGCGIANLQEKLTFVRAHSSGVTHADPLGTLLELTYAKLHNLIPLAEKRALHPSIARIIGWAAHHEQLSRLSPTERYRLLGMLMQSTSVGDFESFKATLRNTEENPELVTVGRRCMALLDKGIPIYQELSKLNKDVEAYINARDYWQSQSEKWQRAYLEATGQSA
ncbi:glycosyltransferase family 2 protein [Paraburkholderia sp. LEh10]|uniref:glycosyltransferase family 2 protein n=1 Tax=Paraburkholderia sp. LEh10 TaxID=2821353 RepID=UPI001AE2DC87|nr:glycosyltransferase family 2 protein [Paraburkholderia sp. LEh10]MBP0593888.1 glycosyltransferase family 2 protein [Paraburkholderia sp. LEh10]